MRLYLEHDTALYLLAEDVERKDLVTSSDMEELCIHIDEVIQRVREGDIPNDSILEQH